MTMLKKNTQVIGADRETIRAQVVQDYSTGRSIRSLAQEIGRSYGFVHHLLKEGQVTFRSRGGNTRDTERMA